MDNFLVKLKRVKTVVLDVDGVLTNGKILITEDGQLLREMSVRDGYAIQLAQKLGYRFIIITGGNSQGVIKRLQGLGITEIHSQVRNKLEVLQEIVLEDKLNWDEILYMGDDMPDYECLQNAGVAAVPNDASIDVQNVAHFICRTKGGEGCVREVLEQMLRLHGQWVAPSE